MTEFGLSFFGKGS